MKKELLDTNVLLRFLTGDNKKQPQKWFEVSERQTLLGLWSWYRQGLHFVDSFLLSFAKTQNVGILTFDRSLLKKVG